MTDFTKKGTKLPVIPVGTEFRSEFHNSVCDFSRSYEDFISYGYLKVKNKIYIKSESKGYTANGFYLIKLSTIERLAKEQGMWESEPNIKVSLNDDTVDALRYLLTAIERKPKIEIDFNPIKHSWIFEEFTTYKSQQMNPTIKLQENGTVTVTDTETTTTLSKVTVDEICRLVKEDKAKLEIRKWYRSVCIDGSENKALFYVTEIKGDIFYAYGFNYSGNWRSNWRSNCYFGITNPSDIRYEIASPETVEQYLRREEQKRYGKKNKLLCSKTNEKFKILGNYRYFDKFGNWCHLGSVILSNTGQWATIINPKTITKAEAEKELGKVITD